MKPFRRYFAWILIACFLITGIQVQAAATDNRDAVKFQSEITPQYSHSIVLADESGVEVGADKAIIVSKPGDKSLILKEQSPPPAEESALPEAESPAAPVVDVNKSYFLFMLIFLGASVIITLIFKKYNRKK